MPLSKGMYARYWDGHAVTYGQIVEVRHTTYCIRVGGMDTVVEVPHGQVAVHTASVASGRLLGPLAGMRREPGGGYLYHATSCDLLASIATRQALVPRSRVDWQSLGGGVWTGAEQAAGRVQSVTVRERDYFAELRSASQLGALSDSMLLGDVGEFFYAAKRHDDALINYVSDVFGGGKSPVVVRFKSLGLCWYQDPKSNGALMTMNNIPLAKLEMKYVPRRLRGVENEDALADHIANGAGWHDCSGGQWRETLLRERDLDA